MVKNMNNKENQDGGVGRHTAPPRTTRTDRKLNGKDCLLYTSDAADECVNV